MFVPTPKHTQTIIDFTQKEAATGQQQNNSETLICQRHQTILRFLFTAATSSTQWRVRELYCQTSNVPIARQQAGKRINATQALAIRGFLLLRNGAVNSLRQ
jgi:hypothetical protein